MPFKMMGKSPLMKKLVGKQGNLPENLKAAIKAAPGTSPGKMVSPLKEDKPLSQQEQLLKNFKNSQESTGSQSKDLLRDVKFMNNKNSFTGGYGSYAGVQQLAENQNKDRFKEKTDDKKTDAKKETVAGGAAAGGAATSGGDRFSKAYAKRGKEYKNMSLSEYTAEAKRQIANRKETGKYIGGTKKPASESAATTTTTTKSPKVGPTLSGTSSVMGDKIGGTKGFSTVKVGGSGGAKATFGKKVINRGSSFTDEYGNTFERSVKGRKKADGSVSKTISNKTNNNTTREKDVTKGAKVKGQRRSKTVIKSKFDSKGDVRKVVEKTRGQKRKVLSDSEIIKRRENLKADRKKRDESPTKMKTKTPSKMMKKAPSKMMKKKSVKKADLKALQSFSKSSKSKYNSAVANKSKQKYPSPSTSKPSKSSFVSKLESKGTIKSSKNLTAAEKKKLASTKTGPAKMMKKKKK